MERMYAFTDEYGAFGYDLDNPSVSTHFIITAVIVKESDLESYAAGAEAIRKKYFQTGEIKSSKLGADKHPRRMLILKEISALPMHFLTICIDKRGCIENMNSKGLQYKGTFYKFMNNIVHRELRQAYSKLTIVADEMGSCDYMKSFCQYVSRHQDQANLLGDADFQFAKSDHDVRIQIADFISGTLARVYDEHKKSEHAGEYLDILKQNIIRIGMYPMTYKTYDISSSPLAEDYDEDIARLCFSRAVTFIENNQQNDDPIVKAQVVVLKYLLFRFMNNDTRGYIFTNELIAHIKHTSLGEMKEQTFRTKIIGKLRDRGVIIASSTKGYKIPSKTSELRDFIKHDAKIVFPMLSRLKKCRDLVKLSTVNELDLLDDTEFSELKVYFDNLPEFEDHNSDLH
ncbi:MAG: DUF3800 domain-containing protein [Clostridia bacterium]|nr:DUF3800 domain-containing protein [Clostridia bacterium]